MNPDELKTFTDLGIKYLMDLRTTDESLALSNPTLNDIEVVRHSGLVFRGGEEIDFSPVGMSKVGEEGINQLSMLTAYYSGMPFDNEAFKILMDKIIDHQVPLVFHCATGKDRTGVAAMIILIALGIPKETVLADYMLSNDYHQDTIDSVLLENKEKIAIHPILDKLLRMRTGVTEEIGRSVLESMSDENGSFDSYLEKEFGLDKAKLQSLRDFYLE